MEISYKIKETRVTTELTETDEKSEDRAQGTVAPPAPFREEAGGEVVGTGTASTRRVSYKLEVLPFFRDGAYLVANLRITNTSDTQFNVVTDAHFRNGDYQGSRFAGFSAVDPETGVVYRAVRIGEEGKRDDRHYVEAAGFPWLKDPDGTNDLSLYLPAPPPGVSSVTFDAGPFGEFEDVPIE